MSGPLAALNIALKQNAVTLSNMKVNEKLADAFQKMSKDENAKNIKEGFGSLEKAVENGNLENAAKSLMDFIDLQSAIEPAMKTLLGQLTADTTGARMELMTSVFDLIKTQGVQDGLKIFGTLVNAFLGVADSAADAVTKLAAPGLKGNLDSLTDSIEIFGQTAENSMGSLGKALEALMRSLNQMPLVDQLTLAIIKMTAALDGLNRLIDSITAKLNLYNPTPPTLPNNPPVITTDDIYIDNRRAI